MTRLIFAGIALLVLSLTSAYARTFTDAGGRVVEIPDRIERVLTAGPPASVLLYTLAPEKLVGWVREPSDAEKEFLLPSVRDLPTYGRLTGRGGTANIEAVLAARPDIIIDVGTVNETYISLADRVQEQTGIPYVLIDGSFSQTPETLRQAGRLLGVEDRAKTLAQYAEATLQDLNDKLATIPADARPRVYYGRGSEGLETGLAGSINLEILDAAGAVNVAAAAGTGSLTNVSPEQVIGWNPDTILAADATFARTVSSDPLWQNIRAVNDGRIFKTPSLPFGWFDAPPGVNRLIGVRWLEKLLYPEVFTEDLDAQVREFYNLFYQVELSDAQLSLLLGDAVNERP